MSTASKPPPTSPGDYESKPPFLTQAVRASKGISLARSRFSGLRARVRKRLTSQFRSSRSLTGETEVGESNSDSSIYEDDMRLQKRAPNRPPPAPPIGPVRDFRDTIDRMASQLDAYAQYADEQQQDTPYDGYTWEERFDPRKSPVQSQQRGISSVSSGLMANEASEPWPGYAAARQEQWRGGSFVPGSAFSTDEAVPLPVCASEQADIIRTRSIGPRSFMTITEPRPGSAFDQYRQTMLMSPATFIEHFYSNSRDSAPIATNDAEATQWEAQATGKHKHQASHSGGHSIAALPKAVQHLRQSEQWRSAIIDDLRLSEFPVPPRHTVTHASSSPHLSSYWPRAPPLEDLHAVHSNTDPNTPITATFPEDFAPSRQSREVPLIFSSDFEQPHSNTPPPGLFFRPGRPVGPTQTVRYKGCDGSLVSVMGRPPWPPVQERIMLPKDEEGFFVMPPTIESEIRDSRMRPLNYNRWIWWNEKKDPEAKEQYGGWL